MPSLAFSTPQFRLGFFLCYNSILMSQNFFAALVGERVHFINPLGRKNSCIVTAKGVVGLFKLQKEGYRFLPVIHKSENLCASCEG